MKIRFRTKDGQLINRLGAHVIEHKVPLHLIEDALAATDLSHAGEQTLVVTHDFGYVIGLNRCVEVSEGDEVALHPRGKRKGYSCVVRGRSPEPTSMLTLVVCPMNNVVITAYFGPAAPREPWDKTLTPQEKEESIAFWSNHALIL